MSPTNPTKSPMISRSFARESNASIHSLSAISSPCGERKCRSMKLLLLGQDGVGKSAFTVRYLTRRFIGEYDPLLEGVFKKTALIGKQEIIIEIKDTARGVSWSKRASDLLWADGLLLIYSITNRPSFAEIQRTASMFEQQKALRDMPCLIIGNKKDLSHERAVTFLEGSRLANSLGGMFCEVSVSDNYMDLEAVVHHFVKEHVKVFQANHTLQPGLGRPEPLRAKSTSDLHKKELEPTSDNDNKSGKGRALWQKLLTSNDIKKSKTKLSA